ncbi:hypothetical protein BH09ACT12_BH09ACT12_05470 [soil metagenome]
MELPLHPLHVQKLSEARSCLAALADASPYEQSIEYEGALLELDALHHGRYPATVEMPGSLGELRCLAELTLEALIDLGADALRIELILARLDDLGPPDSRNSPL